MDKHTMRVGGALRQAHLRVASGSTPVQVLLGQDDPWALYGMGSLLLTKFMCNNHATVQLTGIDKSRTQLIDKCINDLRDGEFSYRRKEGKLQRN